jgi:hypothetical protein
LSWIPGDGFEEIKGILGRWKGAEVVFDVADIGERERNTKHQQAVNTGLVAQ